MTVNIIALVGEGRMGAAQKAAVATCIALNALDGFDVLAMSFAAPGAAKEWGLSIGQLGLLFSAGLAGMTIGSLALAPIADFIGRRLMVLACLMVMTSGMLLSAFAADAGQLAWLRGYTGLGIGGMLPSLNTIVAEYASRRRRDLAVSLMSIGYPIGATVGGLAAVFLVGEYGWRSVFLLGGAASAVMIPVAWFTMPESVEFLVARRPRNHLARLNAILGKMGHAPVGELPAIDLAKPKRNPMALLMGDLRVTTLQICFVYFLTMLSLYFVLSWTPKVLVDLGASESGGISGSVLMNLSGVIGGLLLGYTTRRFGLLRLTWAMQLSCFLFVVLFGLAPANLPILMVLAVCIGFGLYGMVVGLYAIIAAAFPAEARATGAGLAIGVGRLGAVASPLLVGLLIEQGLPRGAYFALLAAPMLVAAFVVSRIRLAAE